jgi:hypothetical protein
MEAAMTVATVVLRRNEDDFITVTVEADVTFMDVSVAFDGLSYRDAFEEFAGLFPITHRELEQMEQVLEDEAVEEARDRLEDAAEMPYVWDSEAA